MKKIGFIGAYDKIDLVIYVAKVLTALGKKVLVVDSTINQKARYIIPVINPSKSYVTEYEEIVAPPKSIVMALITGKCFYNK